MMRRTVSAHDLGGHVGASVSLNPLALDRRRYVTGCNELNQKSGGMYGARREAGVDFFDCENVHNGGVAEQILGRPISSERDSFVITSKCT